jgi:hypothetical protein
MTRQKISYNHYNHQFDVRIINCCYIPSHSIDTSDFMQKRTCIQRVVTSRTFYDGVCYYFVPLLTVQKAVGEAVPIVSELHF